MSNGGLKMSNVVFTGASSSRSVNSDDAWDKLLVSVDPAMRKRQEEIRLEILSLTAEKCLKETLEVLQAQCAIIGHHNQWQIGLRCRFCGSVT